MHSWATSSAKRLWNSPTATTWGNSLVKSLKLLLVTPLILRLLSPEEIAAWYLFVSLTLFGDVIESRLVSTFSRMIAMAMGGATDVSPIKAGETARGGGAPRWQIVKEIYGTTGSLNALLAIALLIVALLLGWFGLQEIAARAADPLIIWTAFFLFTVTQYIQFLFQRYRILLVGLNEVALVNRWNVAMSLLSIAAGAVALSLGGNLLVFVAAMQAVVLLNILRMRFLVRHIDHGRFRNFPWRAWDSRALQSAWKPVARGLVTQLANSGSLKLGSVWLARYAPPDTAASYLFSLSLLMALREVSEAPFVSRIPQMTRLLVSGATQTLRDMCVKRLRVGSWLFFVGSILLACYAEPAMRLIGSNIDFLPQGVFFALSTLMLAQRFIAGSLMVSALGNHFVCVRLQILSFVVSVPLMAWLIPVMPLAGVLVAVFGPQLMLLLVRPSQFAAERLGVTPSYYLWRTSGPAMLCQFAALFWFLS
jgi:O-antigen/teichoic acid export membrane protein